MKMEMLSLLLSTSLVLVGIIWFKILMRSIKINKISIRMTNIISLSSFPRRDATDP